MERKKVVTTCTRDCPSCCGLVAVVEGGRVSRMVGSPEHPLNRGAACRKVPGYIERVYSPERVLHPLRRGRGGAWGRVSWDEALGEMAERLADVASVSGPEAILYYQGFGERTALKVLNARFFAHLGGVTTLRGTLCGGTGYAAQGLDFGPRVSHDPLDLENSRTIILWGRNPAATQFGLMPILRRAKKRSATIILIDPRKSESAALADIHIKPRPGRDAFLALGAARRILETGREDRGFIAHHSEGFEPYRALIERYSIEELSIACDVPLADIEALADAMSDGRPAATLLGWGLHRFEYGHEAIRAVDALGAVSGNIGIAGGGVSQGFEEWGPYDQALWGEDLHPARRKFLMPRVGREILEARDPPIRVIVATAANPVCMAPDSARVAEGFDKAEFVVQMSHFLDDTADHADLFLPCATFLEERDIVASYGHNYVGPVNRAIEPLGECRSQFDIFMDLASRFPFAREYVKGEDEWLKMLLRPLLAQGVAYEELWRGPVRIPDAPMVPWADRVFATPSGKFRFMTEMETPLERETTTDWLETRYSPVSMGSMEPLESPVAPVAPAPPASSTSPRDDRFPFTLLSVGSPVHLCSERTLAGHDPLPLVSLNAEEAARRGIPDGGEATLVSALGSLRVKVRHDPDQRADVAVCYRGGWIKAGHGINTLVPEMVSRVGDGTPYYEVKVGLE